jgi:hypothetical protein
VPQCRSPNQRIGKSSCPACTIWTPCRGTFSATLALVFTLVMTAVAQLRVSHVATSLFSSAVSFSAAQQRAVPASERVDLRADIDEHIRGPAFLQEDSAKLSSKNSGTAKLGEIMRALASKLNKLESRWHPGKQPRTVLRVAVSTLSSRPVQRRRRTSPKPQ